jgi:hypothetical protein
MDNWRAIWRELRFLVGDELLMLGLCILPDSPRKILLLISVLDYWQESLSKEKDRP